jgi:hypothetical protein
VVAIGGHEQEVEAGVEKFMVAFVLVEDTLDVDARLVGWRSKDCGGKGVWIAAAIRRREAWWWQSIHGIRMHRQAL